MKKILNLAAHHPAARRLAAFALFAALAIGVATIDRATRLSRDATAEAARNASGTMSAINGPYVSGTSISSSTINSRLADVEAEITDSLSRSGKGSMNSALKGADGTPAAPAYSFTSEPGTGLYRIGAGDVGFAVSGVKKLELTSAGSLAVGGVATPQDTIDSAGSYNQPLNSYYASNLYYSGGWKYRANGVGAAIKMADSGNGGLTFNVASLNAGGAAAAAVPVTTFTSTSALNTSSVPLAIGSTGTAISASYRGTLNATPANINGGSCGTVANITTVTGAAAGSDCSYGLPTVAAVSALAFTCSISALNTCLITACNPAAAGSVAPGNGIYSCRAWNP